MSPAGPSPVVPSPGASAVAPYRPRPRRPGVDLRLDGNEGPGTPRGLLEALARVDPDAVRCYPDAAPLEEMLAARLGVEPGRVLLTAGADEAIDRACRAFLAPGREAVLPEPTFEMLPRYVSLAGGALVTVPWPDGPFPLGAALDAVGRRTAMVVVVSPNNPTGAVATASDLARLSSAAPGAVLLVDLAYAEFADEDLTAAALALPNAVALRSLSQAWGLAGLRVGYAAGPARLLGFMRASGGPYSVSGPSIALAGARLRGAGGDPTPYLAAVRRERAALHELLRRLGAEPYPSQANFVLARFGDAAGTRGGLAALGIAVREFQGQALLAGCLRITCPGDPAAFVRLTTALERVLAPSRDDGGGRP